MISIGYDLLIYAVNLYIFLSSLIPADLKKTIVCTALREGGEKEWDFAFNRYATTNIATEREMILATLSCSSDVWILSQ